MWHAFSENKPQDNCSEMCTKMCLARHLKKFNEKYPGCRIPGFRCWMVPFQTGTLDSYLRIRGLLISVWYLSLSEKSSLQVPFPHSSRPLSESRAADYQTLRWCLCVWKQTEDKGIFLLPLMGGRATTLWQSLFTKNKSKGSPFQFFTGSNLKFYKCTKMNKCLHVFKMKK